MLELLRAARISAARVLSRSLSIFMIGAVATLTAAAQNSISASSLTSESDASAAASNPASDTANASASRTTNPVVAPYADPVQGASSVDIVRRALTANGEIAAVRLELARARGRLRQAGLRPNPTIDFEQTTGRLVGSPGESGTSVGFAFPVELGGKRQRRVELARAELAAAEAEIADRERQLTSEVRALYAEALAALRELEITEGLNNLDVQTAKFVQVRVNEGETAPLELNLLRVEVERLRSRRALVEGRLQSALVRLQSLAGVPAGEPLRLREDISTPALPSPPATLEAAINIALGTRPDLRLARLNEEVAQAGLRLARAQRVPDIVPFARYTQSRAAFDDTPIGVLRDRDRTLGFGASVGIPVFNRNQGALVEAQTAITQTRTRREFLEQIVRAEVTAAYRRLEAARAALGTFETGVIARSNENIRVIRAAYALGQYRITDLIAEQRRLVDSQREFTEALAEQYRALADVQTAIGAPIEPQP